MKRFLIGIATLVTVTQFLPLSSAIAQEKTEKEEIIIRKKGNKKEKVTIVIDGDNITVDGKPIKKGDKDIIIERFENDEPIIMRMPRLSRLHMNPRLYHPYEGLRELPMLGAEGRLREFKREWKSHAFLGVVTEKHNKGAEIEEVQKETAAEKAGLQKGDIITKVDNAVIDGPGSLAEAIAKKKPNDEVSITYLRDGKEKQLTVKLGETKHAGFGNMENFEFKMNDDFNFNNKFNFEYLYPWNENNVGGDLMWFHNRPNLGVTIQDTEEENGVKVLDVDAESPAAKSGVQKGDLITEVNGKKITNVNQAREALRDKNEKNSWSIKVIRGGSPVTIEVKIPKNLKKADL
jgi:serine protease Do